MRASHWYCALLLLVHGTLTWAADLAQELTSDDETAMEVIEMLGELDDEAAILDIAMSDVNLHDIAVAQEVKDAEQN